MNVFKTWFSNHKEKLFQVAIILVIVFGIIIRASKYLPAWSMRGDELAVTLNLINRSAIHLMTQPLDYEQAAPFGFLLTTKALLSLFGRSEYVLRLMAFLSGCISLILMNILLAKTGGRYGNVFGLSAFAVSHYLIYYSAELKQYSSDVLICLLLIWFFQKHLFKETKERDFWELGVTGTLALCFSHPALFVLIAIGFTLLLHYRKDKRKLVWIAAIGMVWAGVFLAIYLVLLRHQTTSTYLIEFWGNLASYMPIPPWRDFVWFPVAITHLFSNLGGLSGGFLVLAAIYLFGLWIFLRERNWQWVMVLTIPIAINMFVSGFQKFPFHGRLIIYLLPLVYLVFAKGIDGLISLIRNRLAAVSVFFALSAFFLRPAIPTANTYLLTRSYLQDDIKPVLSFISDNQQNDDLIYLHHSTAQQFDYYAPSYGLESLNAIEGPDYSRNAKKYVRELSSLPQGQRIWFLFSFIGEARINKREKQDEREYILNYLMENGTLLDEYYSTNDASSAHLFILK